MTENYIVLASNIEEYIDEQERIGDYTNNHSVWLVTSETNIHNKEFVEWHRDNISNANGIILPRFHENPEFDKIVHDICVEFCNVKASNRCLALLEYYEQHRSKTAKEILIKKILENVNI